MHAGDTLFFQTPGIVLDSIEFEKIRINLKEYKSLRTIYLNNIEANKKLVTQLNDNQKRLSILLDNNDSQTKEINKLKTLANDMSELSSEMKIVNDNFESNNKAFDHNLDEMKENNKKLNQEINRIKRKNIKSHIIIGIVGATLGFFVASSI